MRGAVSRGHGARPGTGRAGVRLAASVVSFGVLASLTGCFSLTLPGLAVGPGDGSWTVLTYSMADTDLEPFMLDDVDEMGEVGASDQLNVVALVDRAEAYTDQNVLGLGDWVGAKLIEVVPGGAEVVDDLGDVNTGDPDALAEFIEWGVANYPADHFALIISDHGASWPGVGADESAGYDSLDLSEMASGLEAGLAASGLDSFDMLGFDACLMATYEVASALAPYAERMLASQELEPGHGWDYAALDILAQGAPVTVDELGAALIDGFEQQAAEEGTSAEVTLSLVDLTEMAAVDAALAEFASVLAERSAAVAPTIGRTLATTLAFGRSPDPAEASHMVDLASMASAIGVDALDVSDAADALVRAVNDTVVDRVAGQAMGGSTGLSIYFPPQAQYYDERYSAVAGATGWPAFLQAYYGAGAAIPADQQAQFVSGEPEIELDADGLSITGEFDFAGAGNIAETYIRFGVVEQGSVIYLGEQTAYVIDEQAGLAFGFWDLSAIQLGDGIDSAYAYHQLFSDETAGTGSLSIPFGYFPPDGAGEGYQDALLSLTFSLDDGALLGETYYAYSAEAGTYGELLLDADGIISPELPQLQADGTEEWIATSELGLWADPETLSIDFVQVPAGSLVYVELWVVDFGGNSDVVSGVAQL